MLRITQCMCVAVPLVSQICDTTCVWVSMDMWPCCFQAQVRRFLVQLWWWRIVEQRTRAALLIQRFWHSYKVYCDYLEWYWTCHAHSFLAHLPWKVLANVLAFLQPSARRNLMLTSSQLHRACTSHVRVLRLAFPVLTTPATRLARVLVMRPRTKVLAVRRSPGFCTADKLGSLGAAVLGGAMEIGNGLLKRGMCVQALDLSFQNILDDGVAALGRGLTACAHSLTRCVYVGCINGGG